MKLFLLLMIPGTFFAGLLDVITRYALREGKIHERLLLALNFFFSGLLLLIAFAMVSDGPQIKQGFWFAFFMTSVLGLFGHVAYYKAFRSEDASLISPIRLLTPPMVLITGFLVLGERASLGGIVGVLTTVVGLWFLVGPENQGQHFGQILQRRGVLLGVTGAVLNAFSLPFDKKAVITSSALFFVAAYLTVVGFVSLVSYLAQKKDSSVLKSIQVHWRIIFLMVIVNIAAFFLTTQALNYALVAYAASVKRLWPFWAVLLGGQFLGEKHIGRRLTASSIMLAGIFITTLFG